MATEYFEERAFMARTSSIVSMAGITVAIFVAECSAKGSQEKKSIISLKIYSNWLQICRTKPLVVTYLQYFTELFSELPLLPSKFVIVKLHITFCHNGINGQAIIDSKLEHVKCQVLSHWHIPWNHLCTELQFFKDLIPAWKDNSRRVFDGKHCFSKLRSAWSVMINDIKIKLQHAS